jgi:WhiB family redox-sensing transcriptional regulator
VSAPEDNWRDRAACAGTAPLWDDVVDGESHEQRTERQAKAVAICRSCPVTEECRRERLPWEGGVWSGRVFVAAKNARGAVQIRVAS